MPLKEPALQKQAPPPMPPYNPPMHRALSVVYMDDDLLVLSKPSGLLSVPGRHADCYDSLEIRAKKAFPGALLTHRLDGDTSGLMVMARNKRAQSLIGKHFQRRLIAKTYIAVVYGHVQGESGLIDLPLRCDWPNRPRQMVCYEHGKPSQTEWKVLERGVSEDGVQWSRMELKPLTGRSHQLRVHMLSLDKENGGHPILGDELYADPVALNAAPRMLLHAQSLSLHHPKDGELVTFEDKAEF